MKKLVALFFTVLVAAESWATVAITSVKARQRSPFDGKVDIEVQLTGQTPGELALYTCVFAATNAQTKVGLATTHIEKGDENIRDGILLTRHFVWDARADIGAAEIEEVELMVGVARKFGSVQLWENGPYWSECNVGANAPEEEGLYFWWGDTVGYRHIGGVWAERGGDTCWYLGVSWVSSYGKSMISNPFANDNFPILYKTFAQLQLEKYIDLKGNLTSAHDAATAHLGAPWRMPTDEDFAALLDNCETTFTSRNGVGGLLVVGRGAYSEKSVFFPAVGIAYGDYDRDKGDSYILVGDCEYYCTGTYWSATAFDSPYDTSSGGFYFNNIYQTNSSFIYYSKNCSGRDSSHGITVRPVRDSAQTEGDISGIVGSAVSTRFSLRFEAGQFEVDATGRIIALVDDCPEVFTIPDGITGIAPDVFKGATNLKHLVVENFGWVKGDIEPESGTPWLENGEYDGKTIYTNNDINDWESTSIEFVIPDGIDTISFAWKVSSEESYNHLYWYLDDNMRGSISGEQDWVVVTEPLSSGEHTIKFTYSKEEYFYYALSAGRMAAQMYDGLGTDEFASVETDIGCVAILTDVGPRMFADCPINELTIKDSAENVPDMFFAAIPSIEKINVPSKEWWLENAPANNNPIFNGSATLYVDGEEIDLGVMLVAVKAQQQNWGDVDIEVQLLGAVEELANYTLVFGATNVATMDKLAITHIEQKGEAVQKGKAWTSHYVWDAKADVGDVFIDDVELTASLVRKSNLAECISTCVTHQSVKTCAPDGGPYTGIVDGVEYTFYVENGEAIIENYIDFFGFPLPIAAISTETSGDIVVPSELGGRPVTKIGAGAFLGCSLLTSVSIPKSVIEVDGSAFSECSSLVTISVARNNEAYCSVEGVLYSKDMKQIVRCPCAKTSVTIPESITTIGDCAFAVCGLLTTVTIPDSVTTIGDSAFGECGLLTTVTIPDSVTTIGDSAFFSCGSLTNVTIPDSVTTIGECTFYGCSSLKSVEIPDSVTTIGRWAFDGCSSLTSVTIPKSVTTIGGWAFYFCDSLKSVEIPASVTTIGESAFSCCNSLSAVMISNGVTTIGDSAFGQCSSLTSITIPSSVRTFEGEGAFVSCTSLKSVTISNGVTTIGVKAFMRCSSLTSVTIPASVTTIGDYAFYDCSSLKSVEIPDSVTTIGGCAFEGCSSLTSVTISNGVSMIGEDAFAWCGSLTSVTIPSSVTTIASSAFYGCDALSTIYVDKGYVAQVKEMLRRSWWGWHHYCDVDDLTFVERIIGVGPSVDGDDTAGVSGNDESGFVIKPSEGIKDVIVTIPEGVSPEKVTIEVSPEVQSVKANGATIKVVKGAADITEFLDIPAAVDGVVNLGAAEVKEEVVKEALDTDKGAEIEISAADPVIETAPTKPGLTYTLVEGATLDAMANGDSKLGDGSKWTPNITVKGGASGFYTIKVTK